MAVVSAFLVPGSPLPYVKRDNAPWGKIAEALERAGEALVASHPDVILLYSTQWIAVLDQLWQARPRVHGVHVDENWHEYGDLPFDLRIDARLARACARAANAAGVKSKAVNYAGFPVDTGTIVASRFLNPDSTIPMVIAANNLYHDFRLTRRLGRIAATQARAQHKRVAVVGVGGLSGAFFRGEIDIRRDRIVERRYDHLNRRILAMLELADVRGLLEILPEFVEGGKADMGFKHFAWILGALGGSFTGATVHAYGPLYGTGAAVIEFTP